MQLEYCNTLLKYYSSLVSHTWSFPSLGLLFLLLCPDRSGYSLFCTHETRIHFHCSIFFIILYVFVGISEFLTRLQIEEENHVSFILVWMNISPKTYLSMVVGIKKMLIKRLLIAKWNIFTVISLLVWLLNIFLFHETVNFLREYCVSFCFLLHACCSSQCLVDSIPCPIFDEWMHKQMYWSGP